MTKLRIALALAVSALAGIGIAAVAAPVQQTGAGAAADALTSTAPATGATTSATGARRAAGTAGVPLPAGGTFAGIQWERGGDAIAPGDIQSVTEYNAACQWLRAWRDGRNAALALRILRAAPQWPSLRGTESGAFLAQVAADAAAGGGETSAQMLADCDASHTREVEYANRLGLTASQ